MSRSIELIREGLQRDRKRRLDEDWVRELSELIVMFGAVSSFFFSLASNEFLF